MGNCQARGLANALRLLLPEAEIRYELFWQASQKVGSIEDVSRRLGPRDALVATRFAGQFADGGDFEAFKAATGALEIPVLVFAAFHPDLVYVFDRARGGGALVRGPMGDYHSALALFGHLDGLSVAQTTRLFAAETYRRLGYLDLWDSSAAGLLEAGRVAGWDLSAELMRWTRQGAFMHSINHPKMPVVADLARGVAKRLGLDVPEVDLDSYLADEFLRQGTWPVYPPVAARYGVPGSEVYLASGPKWAPRALPLDAFLEASFAAYATHRPEVLDCARVAAWRADENVRTWLRASAGG